MIPDYTNGIIALHNTDCMEIMAEYPDNYFDLAVVDPPYGIKRDKGFGGFVGFGGFGKPIARRVYTSEWDSNAPDVEYFDELIRVSVNVMIWGGNFFTDKIPQSNHWIFWDKMNTMPTFGDGELCWTNIKRNSVKQITLEYNGLLGKEKLRIHPTQKPVKLYDWIFHNYSEPGQRILDTHLGSGSSAIAAHYADMKEFVGCEIDNQYFQDAKKRIDQQTAQITLGI